MAKNKEKVISQTKWKNVGKNNGSGVIYAFGAIGVAVYYLQQAATLWLGVLGIIKAIFGQHF